MNDAKSGIGNAFETPPPRLRPYQIVHDWGSDPQEKLDRLATLGIGGIVTNVSWDDRYLKDKCAFRELDAHIDAARRMGLGVWLYDEKRLSQRVGGRSYAVGASRASSAGAVPDIRVRQRNRTGGLGAAG
ncbi:hypothetical protein OMP38_06515 [Cohnella ginsengisoli]|uniref:Uncharacterized protein n=1 Tax=Cohnella ginsengisoli TaxID=425004 RepID=A0A9X4KEL2_9BACL|nr:hypothetical protein [Cohnella ginsengisoli]MDG0790540.1 hypothetical protein [Cohnella ginsengisoli]